MTTSMIITLAIVAGMIALIITDKLPFGAPPLLAAALLVLTNQASVSVAFSGFVDKNVMMVMGFMVCNMALQKTPLMDKLKDLLAVAASKGGMKGYMMLMLVIMVVSNFIGGTAYYVLVIGIISTIPYTKDLPNSRLLLPATFATRSGGWLPNRAVTPIALMSGLIAGAGFGDVEISATAYLSIAWIWSFFFIAWAYLSLKLKLLPDYDITESAAAVASAENKPKKEAAPKPQLTKFQNTFIYITFSCLLVVMVFLRKFPGEMGYGIPLTIACVYLGLGIFSFREMIETMFSPVVLMMAAMIGVAAVMGECGLSDFLGGIIAGAFNGVPSQLLLNLVFGLLSSFLATFTGAAIGTTYLFTPIALALCMQYGYNPIPTAVTIQVASGVNYFMPIDGMPALTLGTGKYKITDFWKFTVPMWIVNMALVIIWPLFVF